MYVSLNKYDDIFFIENKSTQRPGASATVTVSGESALKSVSSGSGGGGSGSLPYVSDMIVCYPTIKGELIYDLLGNRLNSRSQHNSDT